MVARALDKLNTVIKAVCVIAIATVTVLIFVQSISRYFFNHSFYWVDEVSKYALLCVTMSGSVICVRQNAHTRIEFFVMKIPGVAGKIASTVAAGACMCLSGYLSYLAFGVAGGKMKVNLTSLPIPTGIFSYIICASFALMAIGFLVDIAAVWSKKEEAGEK